MIFYTAFAVVIIVLSGLVIWQDERARRQRLEDKIRETKTATEREWQHWGKMVEELITASAPPEEREWRIRQFYRDNPMPGRKLDDLDKFPR